MSNTLTKGMVVTIMDENQRIGIEESRTQDTSFTDVYQRYVKPVYRYALARVNNEADAQDITSQVFMAALNGWKRFSISGNIPAWLFTIARNKIADQYRNKQRTIPIDDLSNSLVEEINLLAGVMNKELVSQVSQALLSLTAEQKELIYLRFAGELSYQQIGATVGKSESAVKMAVYRSLDKLQNLLEQENV